MDEISKPTPMKKKYIQPAITVLEMEVTGMICQSDFDNMTDHVEDKLEELPSSSDKKFDPWESL